MAMVRTNTSRCFRTVESDLTVRNMGITRFSQVFIKKTDKIIYSYIPCLMLVMEKHDIRIRGFESVPFCYLSQNMTEGERSADQSSETRNQRLSKYF